MNNWQFWQIPVWYSAMVASDFEGLGGYRTLAYHNEGQVPTKPYNCCFSRVFQASVCVATYGMSVPSLHTESTDSVIAAISWDTLKREEESAAEMTKIDCLGKIWLWMQQPQQIHPLCMYVCMYGQGENLNLTIILSQLSCCYWNPLIDAELMLSCLLLLCGGAVSVTPCPGVPTCGGCETGNISCFRGGLTSFPEFPVEVQERATSL